MKIENENIKTRIYKDENKDRWSLTKEQNNYIDQYNLDIIGVGLLKKFKNKNKDHTFVFSNVNEVEKNSFNNIKLKKDETICRYISNTTIIGGYNPICILNRNKGTMKFVNDLEAEKEDITFSKENKFDYIRLLKK